MARLPTVAIIGRPNTGKSTLFNRLVGRRKAIVSDVPGTTRDHIAHRIETDEVDFLLVDTGGMGGGTSDIDFEDDVEAQSTLALAHADLIIFTVNGKEDLTSADYAIAEILRKKRKKHVPVIVVVSKMDNPAMNDEALPQFYGLGISDDVLPISAPHRLGTDELTHVITQKLHGLHFGKMMTNANDTPKIAIVGKPNVGKSSIINAFMSETQKAKSPILVSDIAGTTRDSIDTEITYHGKQYIFTDTAGLNKNKNAQDEIANFSMLRTIQSIEQSDVVVIVLDANIPVSRQDKRIASMVIEEGKGIIFLLNKADLLSPEERVKARDELSMHFPFCSYAPLIMCSAVTREGLLTLFEAIETVAENRVKTIPTPKLNVWLSDTIEIGRAHV